MFKEVLKKIQFASYVNAIIKQRIEKNNWEKLISKYKKSSKSIDDEVSVKKAHFEIKRKLNFQGKKDTEFIYVGTDKNQDYSGFAQSLEKLLKVNFYTNFKNEYGLNLSDANGIKTFHDSRISFENGKKLIEQSEEVMKRSNLVIVGQMMANFIDASCIEELSKKNIPIINISMDDKLSANWSICRGRRMGAVGIAKYVDITLTTSPEVVGWYQFEGANAIYFPLASSAELFWSDPFSPERDIDVLFVGNKYGIRRELIDYLKSQGIKPSIWGQGWDNGTANFEKSIELAKRAKIILGVGNVGHVRDRFTLKLRDFDGPMSGAMYITHRSNILEKIFEQGKEIEFYSQYRECSEKIKFYLKNPKERMAIARRGQEKVFEKYNWDSHLYEIFIRLGVIKG